MTTKAESLSLIKIQMWAADFLAWKHWGKDNVRTTNSSADEIKKELDLLMDFVKYVSMKRRSDLWKEELENHELRTY
jgi:hypothetical protein